MPRSLVLGNGKMLVCLDQFGFLRDLYFPYVGLENHVLGKQHRIGIDVDGQFSWLNDNVWQISLGYLPETMVGYLVCKHPTLGVSLVMEDIVYNETNVFVRKIEVYNQRETAATIKLFFNQEFLIQENNKRNTAFYDPTHNVIVHYKGRRVFIINGRTESGQGIDQFTVGTFEFEDKIGSFLDAEDGELSRNAVEHGSVDSVVRFSAKCEPQSKTTLHYWIAAGKSLDEAYQLNELVLSKTPQAMLHSTESFWRAWLNKRDFHTTVLTPSQKKLFDTSLFVLRAHCDNSGSIIASADSAMMEYGKDDYAYMWPRDAAFIAGTLDQAGFTEVTKSFYRFCQRVLHPDGYLHHRFRSDESLGSTWHSSVSQQEWLKDKILQLPIQEDETAGVLVALWKHYEVTKDLEFIEELFKPMIEKMGDFLVNFRNKETGLPLPSYDLWEEKIGISTYTCAAVYGGLMAAARFSEVLDKRNHMREFAAAAAAVKEATLKYLYDSELGAFVRTAIVQNGQLVLDRTVDSSSLFGLWYFGMLDQSDPLFQSTLLQTQQRLTNPGQVGGFIRYEHDRYFRSGELPNPWFITTLWDAQRRLSQPEVSSADLDAVKHTLEWVTKYLSPSGVLAEQLGENAELLSATPLVWSHAVWIETVLQYIKVLEARGECPDCNNRQ
jgi:oligosaccharide amylase